MLNYVEYGKENKYDDDIFFQKYSQMSRSQQGLAGAGEWETLRKLLPDFKDKRVLDLDVAMDGTVFMRWNTERLLL